MIKLIDNEDEVIAQYSDSFTPTQIIQDALQHGYLPNGYIAGFPAVGDRPGVWLIMGVTRHNGGDVRCTNYWIYEGQ